MNSKQVYPWIIVIFRLILGGLFLYAGVIKTQDPQSFADSIATFQILPSTIINLVALSLPIFEIVVGIMLLFGWQKRAASFAILVLLSFFTVALMQALIRGLAIDCGCFGSEAPSAWKTWNAFGRDIVLLLAACWIYFELNRSKVPESHR